MTDAGHKSACRVWRPITWSVDDTGDSIDGIRRNNARRGAFCRGRR